MHIINLAEYNANTLFKARTKWQRMFSMTWTIMFTSGQICIPDVRRTSKNFSAFWKAMDTNNVVGFGIFSRHRWNFARWVFTISIILCHDLMWTPFFWRHSFWHAMLPASPEIHSFQFAKISIQNCNYFWLTAREFECAKKMRGQRKIEFLGRRVEIHNSSSSTFAAEFLIWFMSCNNSFGLLLHLKFDLAVTRQNLQFTLYKDKVANSPPITI